MKKLTLIGLIILLGSFTSFGQELEQHKDGYYKDGVLFSGTVKTTFANGQLESARTFIRGLEDDLSQYYDSTGRIIETRAWRNGKKHGTWITYGSDGIKTGEANYYNDTKHGKWFIWDDKGILRYEMNYENGKKIGLWFMWDENGKLIGEKQY
ncbi:MAG: toxin-antitoxin system YwqK family antitoxin [Bacteroidetes bacterium HGW-Bacteroidetes-1]|jgi:antitoxin component YwqK of YwqJK toxin-antitoxin module|nr:MAG: toxin-antitoxin system YwqK family antitoxin [Bacteroidetes bacterium HGW-Bacteroidetes-1]